MLRFRRRHRLGLLLAPLLAATRPASAAPVSRPLVPGDRVRYVTASGGPEWIRGTLLEVEGSRWLVLPEEFRPEHPLPPSWIETTSLRKAQAFREKDPWIGRGFLVGFVPGALFGVFAAGVGCLDYERPGPCPGTGGYVLGATLFGTVTGGIGALIAKSAKPERWDPIVDGRVRVSVAPTRGPRGRGLGASIAVSLR